MSKQTEKQLKTFRYKFTNNFLGNLTEFSRLHRFDDAAGFKDNWKIWCDNNKDIIKPEIDILKGKGYEGDVLVKMYKSARYYFKNKSTEKKDVKKRRIYVGLDPEFREAIDDHIEKVGLRQEMKPAASYINFLDSEKYANMIRLEKLRLESYNLDTDSIATKLKKTYKNRYFNKKNK